MHLETHNAAHEDREKKRASVPVVDPLTWVGQLEIVEDPYTAKSESRKIEIGFRGRQVRSVSDLDPEGTND